MDGLGLGLLQPRTHNHTSPQGEVEPVSGSAAHQNDILVDAASNFINQLNWSAAKSIRTSIITLASFNVAAAFVTMACIFWDRRSVAKKTNSALRRGYVRDSLYWPCLGHSKSNALTIDVLQNRSSLVFDSGPYISFHIVSCNRCAGNHICRNPIQRTQGPIVTGMYSALAGYDAW
jgi:hypothetical protein